MLPHLNAQVVGAAVLLCCHAPVITVAATYNRHNITAVQHGMAAGTCTFPLWLDWHMPPQAGDIRFSRGHVIQQAYHISLGIVK